MDDSLAGHLQSGMSSPQAAKFVNAIRARHKEKDDGLTTASSAKFWRESTNSNKLFEPYVESVDYKFTRQVNGGAVMSKDTCGVLRLRVFCASHSLKDVECMRFNAEYGNGTFKLLAGLVYNYDPLLKQAAADNDQKLHDTRKEGARDTEVKRVVCPGLLLGTKETYDSVQFLFHNHESL